MPIQKTELAPFARLALQLRLRQIRMTVPSRFPNGTAFLDVNGLPVSQAPNGACLEWSSTEPRQIRHAELAGGRPIDENHFRSLVASRRLASLLSTLDRFRRT
jgi:hypothetical protein